MTDVMTGEGQEPGGLSAADEQLLRELTERARAGGLKLAGEGGLLGLTKMVIEGALEGEMDDHLGYARHDPAGRDGGNSRNGHRAKTVITEAGPVEISVPRDRDSSFKPKIVAKRQRRLTGASGKKKVITARFIHNDRLIDALMAQAFAALSASSGARAFYDELRTRGIEHNDALRRLANRLVGILHGCLKTRTLYDEAAAWGHRQNLSQSSVAA